MLEAQAARRPVRAPGRRMSAWRSEGGRRGGYAARDRLSVLVRDFGCRLRDVAQQGQRLPFHRSRVMQVEQYE